MIASEVSAAARADRATPERIRVRLLALRRAMAYSTRVVRAAQPIADSGTSQALRPLKP
ncbi:hypothetical protein D3C84_1240500 [compost metagenome]